MYNRFKLVEARSNKNLIQKDIAEALGISSKQYGQKELGYNEFTRIEIEKIAQVLELSKDQIIDIFLS